MWYGSSVRRHGRSRPWMSYHPSRRVRNRRRCGGVGSVGLRFGLDIGPRSAPYNQPTAVKIYTKTGDLGETSLFDNTRVRKSDARVDAYGEVDEVNACLGVARAAGVDAEISSLIETLQKGLFALGARLADPSARISPRVAKAAIGEAEVAALEQAIDRLETELAPLRAFILPGGSPAGAALHLARTVSRRAERRAVALGDEVEPIVIVYLNRLSDLLFVMARVVNHRARMTETEW